MGIYCSAPPSDNRITDNRRKVCLMLQDSNFTRETAGSLDYPGTRVLLLGDLRSVLALAVLVFFSVVVCIFVEESRL